MEQKIEKKLPACRQVPGDVLVHYHSGISQHLGPRHGALQPTGLAGTVPGDHKHVLRRPLHTRDVAEDVRLGLPGRNKILSPSDEQNNMTSLISGLLCVALQSV